MKKMILPLAALCVGNLLLSGSGCPLIPSIEEKTVELAVGSSLTLEFHAEGTENVLGGTDSFELDDEIDLAQVVEDAGVDISDVHDIAFVGLAYRVTNPDPNPNRRIEQVDISIARNGGANLEIVSGFEDGAGSAYDFRTLDLSGADADAAVDMINGMLDDLLLEAQGGTPQAPLAGSSTWSGVSSPTGENTNFDWEIRLDISIVGEVTLDLPE
ncbi:MAG: hypothetical protein KDA27_16055 [Candidatus Eisenbacteria bacterium]|uniref:DUF541 domain-containing protein n=1 Tax=Eiseniibacteriota bacterium TaxID=2212470 RepID=A0A956NHV3_UNCEI|nr:hypothetical protein [Candidatus Eisenbacteria bacterium]MCB9463402.1 hypothetical protein [Candidatus Eisenbacteria bacterium]